jgi:hypothetical protein
MGDPPLSTGRTQFTCVGRTNGKRLNGVARAYLTGRGGRGKRERERERERERGAVALLVVF